eukprot:TRINITY_DN3282_c1_g1_i11.p1 TRINITY_DN3282_c1_g1~~TRINITY_DN3282_c1_g1_i11.p1  ORF type:complete len:568 (+),score=241.53 TRINITY_DN3282_c1_g1_i11:55-1704(+)
MRSLILAAVLAAAAAQASQMHQVKSFDGTQLEVNTFEPADLSADHPASIVIFVNSWALPHTEYTAQCEAAAELGYFAVQYSARGWYGSGGLVGPASLNDAKDHAAVIDWVAETWGSKVNGLNVAAAGASYGAGISLIAAAHNPKVKAVVALSGWAYIIDALYWNQAPSEFWSERLLNSVKATGNPPPDLEQQLVNIKTYTNINETREWGLIRSPQHYIGELNRRKVPVFMANNFEDNLFHSNFQIDFWQQLEGPKKLYLGQGTHMQSGGTGLIPGVPNDVWLAGQRWMDRFLMGRLNGIDEAPLVRVEVSSKAAFSLLPGETPVFTKVKYSTWPPTKPSEAYKVLQYGLEPRGWTSSGYGALVAPGSGPSSSEVLAFTERTVMDTGIPIVTALLKPVMLHEINFKKIDSDEEVVFISAPFKQDTRVCGNVVLEGLRARSLTHERFQVMSYLWRVEKAGWFKFLGREATLLAHGPLAVWESTIGEDVALPTISFHALCSDISKGESIALGVNLYNALYKGPTHDNGLRVELKYTRDTILSVPTVALVEEH